MREIRRRLREVYAGSCHLRGGLPPDNIHNAILTLKDIAGHTGIKHDWVRYQRNNDTPKECPYQCPTADTCRINPPCRRMDPCDQRSLSAFFVGWDSGELVKARIGEEWRIVRRHALDPTLAQMAAQARTQATAGREFRMKIDLTEGGPRLRGR